jgi:hypothetical protein
MKRVIAVHQDYSGILAGIHPNSGQLTIILISNARAS